MFDQGLLNGKFLGLGREVMMRRLLMGIVSLVTVLLLSACGGGGGGPSVENFNIGVTVGGQYVNSTLVSPGGSINLAIHAGQSLNLDAGEPAIWTVYVGGTAVTGGVQLSYGGANLTATTLSSSAVAVDTFAPYLLVAAIPVSLVATSTFDAAQVATVNLLITN